MVVATECMMWPGTGTADMLVVVLENKPGLTAAVLVVTAGPEVDAVMSIAVWSVLELSLCGGQGCDEAACRNRAKLQRMALVYE